MSDSQVTDPSASRNNLIPGRLKLVVVGPKLCLGFAGHPNIGIDSIREAAQLTNADKIAQLLLERHRQSGEAVDFLVASLDPPRLAKISSGRSFSDGTQYWIGDADAVGVFAGHYAGTADPDSHDSDYRVAAKFTEAFRATIMDTNAPSVGGLFFTVVTDRDGFRYAPAANVFFPPQAIPSGIEMPLRFGGAAQGGYAYSIYTPEEIGIPIVGAYFLQGRFGLLYRPLVEDEATRVTDVSQDEFRQRVLNEFGVAIRGVSFD